MVSRYSIKEKLIELSEGPLAKLLLLPALVFIVIFVLFPLIWNVVLSFTNYSLVGIHARVWGFIGLRNYFRLLRDSTFYLALSNTFIFTVFSALINDTLLNFLKFSE